MHCLYKMGQIAGYKVSRGQEVMQGLWLLQEVLEARGPGAS